MGKRGYIDVGDGMSRSVTQSRWIIPETSLDRVALLPWMGSMDPPANHRMLGGENVVGILRAKLAVHLRFGAYGYTIDAQPGGSHLKHPEDDYESYAKTVERRRRRYGN